MENQNPNDMATMLEQLRAYIQQQLNLGLNPAEVLTQLQQAGWQNDMLQQAFQLAQPEVMPVISQALNPSSLPEEKAQPQAQTIHHPTSATVTRGRFKTGWLLFRQSLRVLRHNEGLIRYVVMSFIASLILAVVFSVIFILEKHVLIQSTTIISANQHNIQYNVTLKPAGYIVVLVYYILTFFIVNLYSAGLVANVIDIFHGQSKLYRNYMKIARSKGGALLIYSVIEATIGLFLRIIAERSKLLGRVVAWAMGAIWSLARLFVVPVIVTSEDNAFVAIKRSTKLLVSTWGENLVGRVSFAGVAIVLFLFVLTPVSFVLIFLGIQFGNIIGAIAATVIVVLLYLAYVILISTASSVLNTALFYYAQYKQIPAAFDPVLINSVFVRRKRKGLFGPKITN